VLCGGYLYKKGKTNTAWKLRWFSLRDDHTLTYSESKDSPALGVIRLVQSMAVRELVRESFIIHTGADQPDEEREEGEEEEDLLVSPRMERKFKFDVSLHSNVLISVFLHLRMRCCLFISLFVLFFVFYLQRLVLVFKIVTPNRTYHLYAERLSDRAKWTTILNNSISLSPPEEKITPESKKNSNKSSKTTICPLTETKFPSSLDTPC